MEVEQMDVEQTFSNMEDIIRHVDRKSVWQYWTMAKCCLLVVGISTVVYGQAIFYTGKMQYECVLYEDGTDAATAFDLFVNSSSNTKNLTRNAIACALPNGIQCSKWQYESPYYDLTLMNHYDLVCSRSVWLPTFQSCAVLGSLIGLPFWGMLSDRFGRQFTIRFTYALFLGTALAIVLVKPLGWLIALRLFLGFVLSATWNAGFVICMELAVPELRNSIGIYVGSGWPLGAGITSILAFVLPNYRHLSMATLGCAILCAPIVFFVEESPRWMVMHKRFDRAKKLLEKHVKRTDGEALPDGTEFLQRVYRKRIEQETAENKQSQLRQMTRLLTERRLRWRTFALAIVWIGIAFVFHGIMLYGTGSLPFSPMLTLGVMSVIRIFGQPFYVWVSNVFGVRNAMIYALGVTAITMLILGFIPMRDSLTSSIVYAVLYIAGFIAVDLDLSVVYIATGELYPTVLRQSSLGFFSMAARFGNIGAPYVATLFAQYWLPLPAFVFGGVCVVSTLAALALPRADDAMLPETVTEAELIDDTEQISPLSVNFSLKRRNSSLMQRSSSQRGGD